MRTAIKKTKEKQPKAVEPFWREMISTYLMFCANRFDDVPTFSGTAPRNLKKILEELRCMAEEKHIAWTRQLAERSLIIFLNQAWQEHNAIHTIGWFIVQAAKYRTEIIENIKKSKTK